MNRLRFLIVRALGPWIQGSVEKRGRATIVLCGVDSSDGLFVQATDSRLGPSVAIYAGKVESPEDAVGVVVTPAIARQAAASILDAADAADGTAPLVFTPESPDGVEP